MYSIVVTTSAVIGIMIVVFAEPEPAQITGTVRRYQLPQHADRMVDICERSCTTMDPVQIARQS
ncbi:hypothetical protein EEB13_29825 [Rhodococcus sp. WS3]|nr:hypothetical protein EEB13_29825 [Rhodococcus sp. WS3]